MDNEIEVKLPDEIVLAEEMESGTFVASLKRNNKQIKHDRAQAIAEDTQVLYKREVEDLELGIKRMKRERNNMLDLSPEQATSLILASDFNAKDFVAKDIQLGTNIRNLEIMLTIAKHQYKELFGGV